MEDIFFSVKLKIIRNVEINYQRGLSKKYIFKVCKIIKDQ